METIMRTLGFFSGLLFIMTSMANTHTLQEHKLNPIISGYQNTQEATGFNNTTPWWGADLGVGTGSWEKQSWAKYEIPEFPGEFIVQISIQLDDIQGHTGNYSSGWTAWFSPDNEWTEDNITSEHKVDANKRKILSTANNDLSSPFTYNASADITEWFENPNALQGEQLTLRFKATGGGGSRAESVSAANSLIIKSISNPDFFLIIPDDPADGQRIAAELLKKLIERATGEQMPILQAAEAVPVSASRIFVGYGPHLSNQVSPPEQAEGMKILERNGDLFLLGEIAEAGTNNHPSALDRGVMHAVETFAEKVMGYRFLFSTFAEDQEMFELGTVIPELDTLEIESGLRIEDAPLLQHREAHGMLRGTMGLRTGGSRAFNCNHVHNPAAWKRMYGDEHPELFVLREDGTRDWRHLDYAEPLVLEKELEHLEAYFESGGEKRPGMARIPTSKYIMAEPTDNYPDSHSEAAKELLQPSEGWGRQSNLWFDYVRRLAAEVEERWPHMRVSTLAYQWHYYPPDFEIPDNVDVMLCLMRSSTLNKQPAVFDHNLDMVKTWLERVNNDPERLFLWEYWCWPGLFITTPTISPFAMQEWLQTVKPYISGVFINGGGHPQQFQYMMYRLWLRLQWDPYLDLDSEIEDLCRNFYGPAGNEMNEFYRHLINRYEIEWKNPKLIWGQYYATPDLFYKQSYPRQEIEKLASLIEESRRLTELPPILESKVQHGSAVYLFNVEEEKVPVGISLTALDHELVDPTVGWDNDRLIWRGRLQPGERIDINPSGAAKLTTHDNTTKDVSDGLEGDIPTLSSGQGDVFHFWQAGPKKDNLFQMELHYGPDIYELNVQSLYLQDRIDENIFARRLAWLRDPYQVFHPTDGQYDSKQGFLAEAHVAHGYLGQPPVYEAQEVHSLPDSINDSVWDSLSSTELVWGSESGGMPYHSFGFPADLRTWIQFAYTREGLAARFAAEGTPATEESITLKLHDTDFEISIGNESEQNSTLRQLQVDENGWRALIVVEWSELGFAENETPVSRGNGRSKVLHEIDAQFQRKSGDNNYIWSPPLGSPWGHDKQGPGKLLFISL